MGNFESITGLTGFSEYSYSTRNVCPIYLPSGEPYIFYVEQCPDGAALDYEVIKKIGGESTTVLSPGYTGTEEIPAGLRVLAGHHIKKNGTTKTKWIGYRDRDDPAKILPFMEIYSISVSYKKNTNRLDLFFWANVTSSDYVLDNIAIQNSPDNYMVNGTYANKGDVKKQLFHAEGSFVKASINAEIIETLPSKDPSKIDYIPIFNFPTSLSEFTYDSRISDFSGAGGGNFQVIRVCRGDLFDMNALKGDWVWFSDLINSSETFYSDPIPPVYKIEGSKPISESALSSVAVLLEDLPNPYTPETVPEFLTDTREDIAWAVVSGMAPISGTYGDSYIPDFSSVSGTGGPGAGNWKEYSIDNLSDTPEEAIAQRKNVWRVVNDSCAIRSNVLGSLEDVDLSSQSTTAYESIAWNTETKNWEPIGFISIDDDTSGLLPIGPIGPSGSNGINAIDGRPGTDGADGRPGEDGKDGAAGAAGATGPAGATGATGATGGKGDAGTGATGPMGPTGPSGLDGSAGSEVSITALGGQWRWGDLGAYYVPGGMQWTITGSGTSSSSSSGDVLFSLPPPDARYSITSGILTVGGTSAYYQLRGDVPTVSTAAVQTGVSFVYGANAAGERGWYSSPTGKGLAPGNNTDTLFYQNEDGYAGWTANSVMQWTKLTTNKSFGGNLTFDFKGIPLRTWSDPMPGIYMKDVSGNNYASLVMNIESGANSGPRLDMGWGGAGGGNFELYSNNHSTRPGEFRIIYGPNGHIEFKNFRGGSDWEVGAGLSKEGRFFCGFNDTGYPGSGDTYGTAYSVPSIPFQVYNEDSHNSKVVSGITKQGRGFFGYNGSNPPSPKNMIEVYDGDSVTCSFVAGISSGGRCLLNYVGTSNKSISHPLEIYKNKTALAVYVDYSGGIHADGTSGSTAHSVTINPTIISSTTAIPEQHIQLRQILSPYNAGGVIKYKNRQCLCGDLYGAEQSILPPLDTITVAITT